MSCEHPLVHFANCFRDSRLRQQQWVSALLEQDDIIMAHPDDGWVNREADSVSPAYPYFQKREIQVGDVIVLGDPDVSRRCRVIRIHTPRIGLASEPLRVYYFEELSI